MSQACNTLTTRSVLSFSFSFSLQFSVFDTRRGTDSFFAACPLACTDRRLITNSYLSLLECTQSCLHGLSLVTHAGRRRRSFGGAASSGSSARSAAPAACHGVAWRRRMLRSGRAAAGRSSAKAYDVTPRFDEKATHSLLRSSVLASRYCLYMTTELAQDSHPKYAKSGRSTR